MPAHVPISLSVWERGFYEKRGVIKYRHGFKRKVIDTKTTMGKLLCVLIFIFVFTVPLFYDNVHALLLMLMLMVMSTPLFANAYSRPEKTEFNLIEGCVAGSQCYREEEGVLDFLFPRSDRRPIETPKRPPIRSLELRDIICVIVYNNHKKKSANTHTYAYYLVVISGSLQSEMILLEWFAYSEEDHLNDYVDGVQAILGGKIWIDRSEQ